MPVIKSAKKKLRQDKKRTAHNKKLKESLLTLIKQAKKKPTHTLIQQVAQAADKAAKKHIIHKNKAARVKATIAKLLQNQPSVQTSSQEKKTKKKSRAQKSPVKRTIPNK